LKEIKEIDTNSNNSDNDYEELPDFLQNANIEEIVNVHFNSKLNTEDTKNTTIVSTKPTESGLNSETTKEINKLNDSRKKFRK